MTLNSVLAVAIGGGAGSVLRYLLWLWLRPIDQTAWPWPTLLANVVGCLLLGCLQGRTNLPPLVLLALATGFCGGLTTFSTFSGEVVRMSTSFPWRALFYTSTSLIVGLGAYTLGWWLSRRSMFNL